MDTFCLKKPNLAGFTGVIMAMIYGYLQIKRSQLSSLVRCIMYIMQGGIRGDNSLSVICRQLFYE